MLREKRGEGEFRINDQVGAVRRGFLERPEASLQVIGFRSGGSLLYQCNPHGD
jgi:hypothetical protein